MKKYQTGLIFGKFFPLHPGHVLMMEKALSTVNELYVFVCSDTERDQALFEQSQMIKMPTRKERLAWFAPLVAKHSNLHPIDFNEDGIPFYPNGWLEWSNRVKAVLADQNIHADVIFSSEPQDVAPYEQYFQLPVQLIDPDRAAINISATKLRTDPDAYKTYLLDAVYPYFFD